MRLSVIWLLSALDRQVTGSSVTRDKVGAVKTLVINLATAPLNIEGGQACAARCAKSRSLRIRKLLLEFET
jgi:hypothetical protein